MKLWKRIGLYLVLVGGVVYCVFPLYWAAVSSLKVPSELLIRPPKLLVHQPTLQWYFWLISRTHFLRYVKNTLLISLATVFLNVCFASMAAFSFTKFRYRGRVFYLRFVIFIYLFPQIIIVLPLYVIFSRLGLISTYQGLIIAYLTITLPFSIWLLSSYFRTIPGEIEEAARIDGCSNFGVFWRIILPLVAPALVATAVFAFIVSWNEFLYGFLLINEDQKRTLAAGFYNQIICQLPHWGVILAWVTVAVMPPLIFFAFIYRYIIRGLMAGAVKG